MVSASGKILIAVLVAGQVLATIGMARVMMKRETDFVATKAGETTLKVMNAKPKLVGCCC